MAMAAWHGCAADLHGLMAACMDDGRRHAASADFRIVAPSY